MSLRVLLVVVMGLLMPRPAWADAPAPKAPAAGESEDKRDASPEEDAPPKRAASKDAKDAGSKDTPSDDAAPEDSGSDASGKPAETGDDEKPSPEKGTQKEKRSPGASPTDADAKDEAKDEASKPDAPPKSADAKPTPSPDGPTPVAAAAATKAPTGHGLVVVAGDAKARGQARNLARAAYKDPTLRPRIDEPTARVLAGDPAPKDKPALSELASTVEAVSTLKDDAVRRRLLGAMSAELGVQRAVLVESGVRGPRARVVEGGRFRSVTLSASKRPDGTWDWSDAVAMLRSLSIGTPAPGPRRAAAPKPKPGPAPTGDPDDPDDDDEFNLLTSPWFWGGLGVVVTVGVTVFVLSRTALNEPDEVMIQGRIAP